jgi:hypothetical protein
MLIPIQKKFTKTRLLQLLNELETITESAISIYLPVGSTEEDISRALTSLQGIEPVAPVLLKEVMKSTVGAVIFWGVNNKFLILPPFPVLQKTSIHGYEVNPLRNMLKEDFTIAVVLIRLGSYAIGLFQNNELVASKVGTGLVHSRHKKGGSSQHRFARHREKQIEYFFTNVCEKAREKLEPFRSQIDLLFFGGESNTVRAFINQCRFMETLLVYRVDRLLNIREPKQRTLTDSINHIWESGVIQIIDDASNHH